MLKAIGRWGSHVKSSTTFQYLSNLFGSKSNKYGEICREDEEDIFCDALDGTEPNSECDVELIQTEISSKIVFVTKKTLIGEGDELETNNNNTDNEEHSFCIEHRDLQRNFTENRDLQSNINKYREAHSKNLNDLEDSIESPVCDKLVDSTEAAKLSSNHNDDDADHHNTGSSDANDDKEDHHNIGLKDSKHILKDNKQQNTESHSVIKKVHRRINSYSLRQYSKFENSKDDSQEVIEPADNHENSTADKKNNEMFHDIEEVNNTSRTEKKNKKRKKTSREAFGVPALFPSLAALALLEFLGATLGLMKKMVGQDCHYKFLLKIAKTLRQATRGSWKWFKRSLIQYSYMFNFTVPTASIFFMSSGKSSTKKY